MKKRNTKRINRILSQVASASLAAIVVIGGLCFLGLGQTLAKTKDKAVIDAEYMKEASLPTAGVGKMVNEYIGATGKSSIELLSTTALGSGLEEFNEYYDGNGEIVGKLIVCKEMTAVNVYDRIPGNERIEQGDTQMAQVVGQMNYGDVATLIEEQGYWFKVVADTFSGYTRKELYATGKEAEALNGSTWDRIAIINEADLYLNSEPTYESTVLCMLDAGLSFSIVEDGDPFTKINVPGAGEGWVENTLITITEVRKVGKTIGDVEAKSASIAAGVERANALYEAHEEAPAYHFEVIAPAPVDTADIAAYRQAVVDYAASYVGWLPYVWGGNSLESGADCSGFVQAIYAEFGVSIPRTCEEQLYCGTPVSLDDMRPGDIINYGGHVALYAGDGTVIHEPVPGDVCSYQSAYMMPIYGVVRVIN